MPTRQARGLNAIAAAAGSSTYRFWRTILEVPLQFCSDNRAVNTGSIEKCRLACRAIAGQVIIACFDDPSVTARIASRHSSLSCCVCRVKIYHIKIKKSSLIHGTRSRTFLVAVAPKNFSTLLARPILLNGCPRSLSSPCGTEKQYVSEDILRHICFFCCPTGTRTPINGFKGRCPTIRRSGNTRTQ